MLTVILRLRHAIRRAYFVLETCYVYAWLLECSGRALPAVLTRQA